MEKEKLTRRRWTQEEDDFLLKNYSTIGPAKCAILINRDQSSISIRARNHLNLPSTDKRKFWEKEEISFLQEHYPSKGSIFCAEKLQRSSGVVRDKAIKMKLKNRIPKIMNSDLIELNTKSSNYIAGLLFADGFLSKDGKTLSIGLVSEDMKEIIHLFKEIGEWCIYECQPKNRRKITTLKTRDKKICEFFKEMEYDKKSYTEPTKILSKISEENLVYWLRGFADGDANWYKSKSTLKAKFSISGRHEYMWEEIIKIYSKIGISKYSIERTKGENGSYSKIHIERRGDIVKMGNYIYSGFDEDKIGLTRKYEKFKDILNSFQNCRKPKKSIVLIDLKTNKEYNFESMTLAGKFLKTTSTTIKNYCQNQKVLKGYRVYFSDLNQNKI